MSAIGNKMSNFIKILVAIDTKIKIDKGFIDLVCSEIDKYSVLKFDDTFEVPLHVLFGLVDKLKKESAKKNFDDIIYKTVEKHFNNYHEELHDIIQEEISKKSGITSLWESYIVYPTIFIRDRKQDNIFKSKLLSKYPRILQFMVDESVNNPREDRVDKMFSMGINHILAYVNKQVDNNSGIQYILWKANVEKVPTKCYQDRKLVDLVVSSKPTTPEITDCPDKIDVTSKEYQEKLRSSIKMIRKTYYESLKNRPETKMLDIRDLEENVAPISKKMQTKALRKKKLKKEKKEQITELRLIQEQTEEIDDVYE